MANGWKEGVGWSTLKQQMAPLAEWTPDDEAEMSAMLDKAAAKPHFT
jgi:hypothetical protein